MRKHFGKLTPHTYNVRYPNIIDREIDVQYRSPVWFVKNANIDAARDIHVINNPYDFTKIVGKEETRGGEYVLQPHVPTLRLLEGNRKFHIRIYVVLLFIKNQFRIFAYPEGIVMISPDKYEVNTDIACQVTNSLNAKKIYEKSGRKYDVMECQKLYYANNEGVLAGCFGKMCNVIFTVFKEMYEQNLLYSSTDGYELFGLDFVLDQQDNPWIIEFNHNPYVGMDMGFRTEINMMIFYMILQLPKLAIEPIIFGHKIDLGSFIEIGNQ